MMEKIYIGITTRKITLGNQNKYFVNQSYFQYFHDPIILIPLNKYNVDHLLNYCQGFIISGGDDINPSYYGERNEACHNIDEEIDELDFKIIDFADKSKKPVLGICRGIQVINVYYGGTLFQDVLSHQNVTHQIKESLFNDEYVLVNSFHHQAIKTLGKDLVIKSSYLDVPEIIINEKKKIIGVQFHPEIMNSNFSKKILEYFITMVKK